MQNDNILEKAKKLGLNTGNSSNHIDNLRTVAEQLGIDFDSLNSISDLENVLDQELASSQSNQEESLYDNQEEFNETSSSQNSSSSSRTGNQRAKFGEKEYNQALGEDGKYNKDFYKDKAKDIDDKLDAAKQAKDNKFKKVDPSDNKKVSPDGSDLIKKTKKEQLKDNLNYNKLKYEKAKNGWQAKKARAYEKMHPLQAAKNRASKGIEHATKEAGKKAASGATKLGKNAASGAKKLGSGLANAGKQLAKKTIQGLKLVIKAINALPLWAKIMIVAIAFIFLIILLHSGGVGDGDGEAGSYGYFDPAYDYNQTIVSYTNEAGENVELSISDYVKGVVYNLTKDGTYTDEQIKAMMVVVKTNVLSEGNYSNTTMKVTASSAYTYEDYTEMSEKLNSLYSEIENELYLPNTYSGGITSLSSSTSLELTPETFLEQTGNYNEILDNVYNTDGSHTIYDLADHVDYYTVTNNGGGDDFWWPIGSSEPTNGNIYGGKPIDTYIREGYVWREWSNKWHQAIDITGGTCVPYQGVSKNVIIASKSGVVTAAYDGCASYGYIGNSCGSKGTGNYVIIDHQDGTETVYYHMMKDSIVVKKGQTVSQGQKIGIMGSSGNSSGCHLHFGIKINGSFVDPEDYVSEANPRPVTEFKIKYVDARVNKQKVCKTLLASGFSEPATIAMMINIQEESTFNPNAIGDSGTSYGLCQWHLDRWDNLKKHRPNDWETISGQLEYLVYELKSVPRFARVYKSIVSSSDAKAISQEWCYYFEVPDKRDSVCPARTNNNITHMTAYVQNGCQ